MKNGRCVGKVNGKLWMECTSRQGGWQEIGSLAKRQGTPASSRLFSALPAPYRLIYCTVKVDLHIGKELWLGCLCSFSSFCWPF